MSKTWRPILQFFIAPIVTACAVVGLQLHFQPRIAEESLVREELWKARFEAYSEAFYLLNRYVCSRKLHGEGISEDYVPDYLDEAQRDKLEDDLRNNYSKLVLLANDPGFVSIYTDLFVKEIRPVEHLYHLMKTARRDLRASKLDLAVDEFKFIIQIPWEVDTAAGN